QPIPEEDADASRSSTPDRPLRRGPRFNSPPIWDKNVAERTRTKWKEWAAPQKMRLYVEVVRGPKKFRKEVRQEAVARTKAQRAAARRERRAAARQGGA
ncbi:hypothetical protein FRC07_012822, partial [Ceratobasidium sp. 392]